MGGDPGRLDRDAAMRAVDAVIARSDDEATILAACARALVSRGVDACVVDRVGGDRAVARADGDDAWVEAIRMERALEWDGSAPIVVEDVGARGHALPPDVDGAAERLGARSVAVVGARGVRVALFARARRIRDADARVAMEVAARAGDAIDRARLARRARVADRALEVLLGTVAHELRGPLAAIAMWTHVLSLDEVDAATRARAVQAIDASVRAQSRLVEDVLDLARALGGKLRVDDAPLVLGEAARAAIAEAREAAAAKSVRLVDGAIDRAIVVRGDAKRLARAIGAVIARAVERAPEGGRVAVTLAHDGARARVEVRDDGPRGGELLPDAIDGEPRGSSHARSSAAVPCALARRVIGMHGGAIDATATDDGARFALWLPLPVPREAHDPARRARRLLAGARVLVVDDDAAIRDALRTVLASYGATARAAASAGEAIALLDDAMADAVVTDLGMPDEDGFALLARLRARPLDRGGAIPAVALSGQTGAELRERARAAGFQRLVSKPVDAADLALALGALLRAPRDA